MKKGILLSALFATTFANAAETTTKNPFKMDATFTMGARYGNSKLKSRSTKEYARLSIENAKEANLSKTSQEKAAYEAQKKNLEVLKNLKEDFSKDTTTYKIENDKKGEYKVVETKNIHGVLNPTNADAFEADKKNSIKKLTNIINNYENQTNAYREDQQINFTLKEESNWSMNTGVQLDFYKEVAKNSIGFALGFEQGRTLSFNDESNFENKPSFDSVKAYNKKAFTQEGEYRFGKRVPVQNSDQNQNLENANEAFKTPANENSFKTSNAYLVGLTFGYNFTESLKASLNAGILFDTIDMLRTFNDRAKVAKEIKINPKDLNEINTRVRLGGKLAYKLHDAVSVIGFVNVTLGDSIRVESTKEHVTELCRGVETSFGVGLTAHLM